MSVVDRVRLSAAPDRGMASVLARRGVSAAAIGAAIGIEMPAGPGWVAGDGIMVSGIGPGAWLAQGEGADWCGALEARLEGLAGVIDQAGAYRVFQLEGPDACRLLQRGAAVDLDGSIFPAGSVVSTLIGHVDVVICCLEVGKSYEVAVYRSYAESFLRWVDAAIVALLSEKATGPVGEAS